MTVKVRWQRLPSDLWPRRANAARSARTTSLALRVLIDDLGVEPGLAVIAHRASGAPFVPCVGVHVSLSHSWSAVAVAVSDDLRVGVDIEARPLPRSWRDIAETYFSTAERASLQRGDADAEALFRRYWTTKEALTKLQERQLADFLAFDTTRIKDGTPFDVDGRPAASHRAQVSAGIHLALAYDASRKTAVDIVEVPPGR